MAWLLRELRTGQPTGSGELERLAGLAMDLQLTPGNAVSQIEADLVRLEACAVGAASASW